MLDRIAQILDDLFGIPCHMVEESDHLIGDWGLDNYELEQLDAELIAEFGRPLGDSHIIADYIDG